MTKRVNVTKPQETADLVTFTEKILNGKYHFLCSDHHTGGESSHQKTIFSIKDFFSKCDQITFTEETIKLHFLCSGCSVGISQYG